MIGKDEQDALVRRLLSLLPDDHALLVLGNTASIVHGITDITTTKDVDVAIIVLGGDRAIAPYEVLLELMERLGVPPKRQPDDQSWVQILVKVGDAERKVDLIRGRSRDRENGTFIERKILQEVAQGAAQIGRVLVPGTTDLVVMKAWAAVDQARHLQEEKDPRQRRFHEGRLRAYTDDARRVAEWAIRRSELEQDRIGALLKLMKPHRQRPVREVLIEIGALIH
jgi:hypothetical protein